ncbi:response regulator [Geobacter sp. DSM 9736]|uniref:hybrid sensor histidine kinase/response regulator n=1 Tax=Geobacter sp. DSM 9736 TaxID=1277350 RepID=UPI000B50BBA7|nr:response regulator [Geobacter sp. DSM 9736]SNB45978.1 PAS domain-containing protein [Geobacter sp. DSM 9736]
MPGPDIKTDAQRAFVVRLVLGVLAANLFVLLLAGVSVFQSRQQHESRVRTQTQNLAGALETSLSGMIDKIDIVLRTVADETQRQIRNGGMDAASFVRFVDSQRERVAELYSLRVSDEAGNISYENGSGTFNISDRDYFIRLRQDPNAGLVISRPVFGVVSKRWLLGFARRIDAPDGSFAGVVQGTIPIDLLTGLFASFELGSDPVVTLRDAQLNVVARYPSAEGGTVTINSRKVSREFRSLIQQGHTSGTYLTSGSLDDVKRMFSYRKLPKYPLYVNVGRATGDYLADWWRDLFTMSSLVVLFALGTLYSSRVIFLKWKNEQQAEEELRRANRDLEERVAERTVELCTANEQLNMELNERKKAEQITNRVLSFVRTLLASSPTGILVYEGASGKCVLANDAVARMIGGSVAEIEAQNFRTIASWRETGFDLTAESVLADGVTRRAEKCFASSFKKSVCLECLFSRFENDGVPHLLVIAMDVSEKKTLEDEKKLIQSQMLHVQKLESLGVLAGGIAHDFNNILMAVLGNADMALIHTDPQSPAQENIRQIEKAARRAADLARQMLAYSGKGHFQVEPVSLRAVVEEMTELLEVSISKKAALHLSFSSELPLIEADATQLRQVIMNLVINASEALGDAVGDIHVSAGRIECDAACFSQGWLVEQLPEGSYVYLEVSDTGPGIDPEVMGKIFDPFFSTKFTGRGLGMATVLGIVRGHKGTILVRSEKGRGASFRVLLPVPAEPAPEVLPPPPTSDAAPASGTVLLVDDEESIRSLGKEMLQALGYDVLTAADGAEGIRVFESRRDEVRCILLDLTMPHLDGKEALAEIRGLDPDVPILLSSGYHEQEVGKQFLNATHIEFIQKPFGMEQLKQKLHRLLSGESVPGQEGRSL